MVIILTGAGISKSSNLDTFEDLENKGINFRKVLDRKYANENWEKFSKQYIEFATKINKAEPNNNHEIINEIAKQLKDDCIVATMNVDSLHKKAGTKVYELHGNCINANPEIDNMILYGDLLSDELTYFLDKVSDCRNDNVLFVTIGTTMQTSTAQMIVEELQRVKAYNNCNIFIKDIKHDLDDDFIEFCIKYNKLFKEKSKKSHKL